MGASNVIRFPVIPRPVIDELTHPKDRQTAVRMVSTRVGDIEADLRAALWWAQALSPETRAALGDTLRAIKDCAVAIEASEGAP